MRTFSAIFSPWSIKSTFSPSCPATPAHNRPAAPAPMTTVSNEVKSSRFPGERKLELAHEAVGHVVAQHAVRLRPQFAALHRGAEQVVEEGEVRGVVLVQRFLVLAVVPVVEVGCDDHVAQ